MTRSARGRFGSAAVVGVFMALVAWSGMPPSAEVATPIDVPGRPERPRSVVDTQEVAPSGRTIRVAAGGDLQAAIDGASPGDLIALEPGATYHGPFRLPRKDGSGWIAI